VEVIILAGGFGTRLQSVVKDVPKPMADISGKPFLEYLFKYLVQYNINHVVLSVGYRQEVIKKYFGSSYDNIKITYSCETEPLGTGGAIKQALKYIKDEVCFVLNGDTFFNINLNELVKHGRKNSKIIVALKGMLNINRYGSVQIDQYGNIEHFKEKQFFKKAFINGGVYFLKKNIFESFKSNVFSFEKYLEENFQILKAKGLCFNDKYFVDIGIPEDYKKAQKDLIKRKALFLDRDGIVNIDTGHLVKISDFKFSDSIFELCKFFQQKDYRIFIITNQAGIAKGYYTEDDFNVLTQWMLNEFIKNSIFIDKVYYCPHHPTDGISVYKQNCDCRKPKDGMLQKAVSEFNVDLSKSILIGDKLSDIEAGKMAGILKNILIKSDYQIKYDFENLDALIQYLRSEF
jgi:D,D-heptose 1,7-bisphosphate phosphatase